MVRRVDPVEIAKIGIPPLAGIVATILAIGILALAGVIFATPVPL